MKPHSSRTLNPKKTALLVIDMQNDFIEKGAILEIKNIRHGLSKLSKCIATLRKKGVLIIFTKHVYDPKNNPVEAHLFPELAHTGLRRKTHGADITQKLTRNTGDVVLEKTRYDCFYKTNLEVLLKRKDIANLIITGTMTNVCCDSTARGAMYRDFTVWFSSDLTFASDKKVQAYSLKTISANFGYVKSTKELLALLK